MKLKIKNKKKVLIIASLIAIILIGAIVSVVVVFAANVQNTETNVRLTYVVNGVGANVSANYAVLPNDESQLVSTTSMTTDENSETIEFKPSGGTQTASLEPAGDLTLTTKKQRAVIEYIFENTADSAFSITLTSKPTGVNMTERYLVSGRRLEVAEYYGYITDTTELAPQALTSNGSVAYIYIMIEVTNENKVASYEGEFKWVLEKQDTVTINLDNGDSTGGLTSLDIIPTSSVSGIAMPVVNTFPTSTDETMGFAGYFAEANGSGTQYISALGGSMNEADLTVTDKLYAYFSDIYYVLNGTEVVSLTEAGKNMSTLTLSSDITSISANAFYGADAEVITYEGAAADTASYADSTSQLTSVGANAFGGCTNLKELRLPSSVTTIGSTILTGCTSIETIEFPYILGNAGGYKDETSGILKLFGSSYEDIANTLTTIEINGSSDIGDYALWRSQTIKNVKISKDIANISARAFAGAFYLETLVVEEGNAVYSSLEGSNCIMKTADNELIAGCATSVIPESTKIIGSFSFHARVNLTEIVVPNGVTYIGKQAFFDCSNLTSVELPDSIMEIGDEVFQGCKSLTTLTIPSTVTTIGSNVLSGCTSLETLEFPYVLGEGEGIVDGVYISGFSKLFGQNNTSIPSKLQTVAINGGAIDKYAFYMCSNLKNVTIGNTITTIGEYAFAHCKNINSIIIPKSVTNIELYVLAYCTGLTSIIVEDGNTIYNSGNGANCIIETATNSIVAGCEVTIIPEGILELNSYVFYGSDISNIEIPDGVTIIGGSAFNNCRNLTSITIPASVECIGLYAFKHCTQLSSVTFEDLDGWFLATSIDAESGTVIDVSNAAKNAANLANLTDNSNFTENWSGYYLIKKTEPYTIETTDSGTMVTNISSDRIYLQVDSGTSFSYGAQTYTTSGEYLALEPNQSVTLTTTTTALAYANGITAFTEKPSDLATAKFYAAYGAYPQTYVGATLNSTLTSASLTATGKSYTTDINGTTTTLAEYEYNGVKYAKLASSNANSSNYTFSTGETVADGQTYFFKVEPIVVKAMEINETDAVVMTVDMMGSKRFDGDSNDWETSELRTYLNGTFLTESGLSSVAQSATISNDNYFGYAANSGDTTDQLWLPSAEEIILWSGSGSDGFETFKTDYWLDDAYNSYRKIVPNDMALATYSYFYKTGKAGYCFLRSAGAGSSYVCYVNYAGHVTSNLSYSGTDYGFSPAFYINL